MTENTDDVNGASQALYGQYDKTRRLLYSHPRVVKDLLRFIDEPWVKELDFRTLKRMPDSHVTERLQLRFEDVVWRVRWRGHDVYLCLLLEFQSTVDPYMVFRVFFYVAAFYLDLIRQVEDEETEDPDVVVRSEPVKGRARPPKLPLVIPIVSYNGRPRWWSSRRLRESIACPPEWGDLVPDLTYLLHDQLRIPEETLGKQRDNATIILARIEKASTPDELGATIVDLAAEAVAMGLARPMGAAIKAALIRLGVPETDIPEADKLLRSDGMLVENLLEWKKSYTADVRKKGIEKGIEKGEALVLTNLLESKFGRPLPAGIVQRIRKADADSLLRWAMQVLKANSLEAVFADAD